MVRIGDFEKPHFIDECFKNFWQSNRLEIEQFWDFELHLFVADLKNVS